MLPFVKDFPKPGKMTFSYRNYKDIDLQQFCHDLEVLVKSKNFSDVSLNDALRCFNESIVETMNTHAPIINKKFSQKRTEFTNPTILSLRRLRRKYECKYRRTNNRDDLSMYNYYVSEVRRSVNSSRNNFYGGNLHKNDKDKKKKFKFLKQMLGEKKDVILPDTNSDQELCNDFENFFVGKIVKIRDDITESNANAEYHDINMQSLNGIADTNITPFDTFSMLTCDTLYSTMNELSNKQCELDAMPTDLFKRCVQLLPSYVLKIINLSLDSGTFPDELKTALVRPDVKDSSLHKDIKSNYRPISNLSFFSKLIEKCVLKQLITHLDIHNLFGDCQSAYRQFHGFETALTKVSNDILNNLDQNCSTFLIMLDLSAAFDTVDHCILLERLETKFHIKGTVLKWF